MTIRKSNRRLALVSLLALAGWIGWPPIKLGATMIVNYGGTNLVTANQNMIAPNTPITNGLTVTWVYSPSSTAVTPTSGYTGIPLYGTFQTEATLGDPLPMGTWNVKDNATADRVNWNRYPYTNSTQGTVTATGIYFIKQANFANGLSGGNVTLDAASAMALNIVLWGTGNPKITRFAVLNDGAWYLSSSSASAVGTFSISNLGAENFGSWDPSAAPFGPAPTSFPIAGSALTKVQAVGIYVMTQRSSGTGNIQFAWDSLAVSAAGEPSPVSAANSTVSASPTSVTADGITASTITVTLKDAGNNAVSNKTVTFTSSRGAVDTISPDSGLSATNGVATFTVKSLMPGSADLTATGDGVALNQSVTVTFNALPDVVDKWRAMVAEYPIPTPPPDAVKLYPTNTLTQIKNIIANAGNNTAFLLMASAPDTPTTYRRWSVTPKTGQKFYGELHSDGRTRLITLKGSKDLTPGVVSWTTNDAGIWNCTETDPLGGNYQAERYLPGYKRNAYGRVVVIDGATPLNHLWPPSATQGQLVSLEISNAGSGYQPGTYTGVALTPVSGTNGTGAAATVDVGTDGKVASVALTAGGQGYDGKNVTGSIPGGGGWQCKVADFVRAITGDSPDTFCLDDPADTLYLGFNPAGHTVEIMTDLIAFGAATGVELYNLRVQHYANQIQDRPVRLGGGGRAEYMEISYNHAGGIQCGDNATIRNCLLTHNLQKGYNAPGVTNGLFEGNEISYNCNDLGDGDFPPGWDSGGGKTAGESRSVIFRNNYVHDNGGVGIWFDIDCGRPDGGEPVIAEGNITERNQGAGIFQEIGWSAIFRGNYCRDDKITVAESGPVQVYGNIVKDGRIGLRQMNRVDSWDKRDHDFQYMGGYYCKGNYFHHNQIINGTSHGLGNSAYPELFQQLPPFGNNYFDYNTYHMPDTSGAYWAWNGSKTFDQFRQSGHETNGLLIGDGATYADTTPPTTPPRPTMTGGGPVPPTLSGTSEIASMIRVYEGSTLVGTTFADENGAWSVTLTGLSTNNHELHVTAADPWKTVSDPSPLISTFNAAPSFAPLGNRTMDAGETMEITSSATDVDAPPQTLTYSLLNGPAGASVETHTGLFAWRAPVASAGSTVPVEIRVTDSGYPALSATRVFEIHVNQLNPLALTGAAISNGTFSFMVTGPRGPDYTVQGSTDLWHWTDFFTVPSPEPPFSWGDPDAGSFGQRFYRVKIGP